MNSEVMWRSPQTERRVGIGIKLEANMSVVAGPAVSYFICADDYTESIDMPTALHPQTILATKYAGEIIGDPFGYPFRLRASTKLGYKNAKKRRSKSPTISGPPIGASAAKTAMRESRRTRTSHRS
jgi:DMSO/TMAO reductase YedYZ molybdopterin-dependent catalytic subunit